ncbi:LysR substrate-binding domain-containing protein [Nocardia takedensis]
MDLRALRYFVAVAEERHVGRAATRLRMTQPPLSRAIRELESELGVQLFERTPKGVTPTAAGAALYPEAIALLRRADRLRGRVAAAGAATLTIGTLADTATHVGGALVSAFRRRHPHVRVGIHEADLGDPAAGLRTGAADLAFTRTPFADSGLRLQRLRSVPVGVVLRDDDPLAGRPALAVAELTGRCWVRLPPGTDPIWTGYWTGGAADASDPVLRTVQECVQSVLWNGTTALAPLDQPLPAGLIAVPCADRPPSDLVLAWPRAASNPLIRAFVRGIGRALSE